MIDALRLPSPSLSSFCILDSLFLLLYSSSPILSTKGSPMLARILLLPLALVALCSIARAQAPAITDGEGEISPDEMTINLEAKPTLYAGEYHFGFSEGESSLTLAVKGSSVSGIFSYGVFDEKSSQFKPKRHRFQGKIVGAMLVAPGWQGVFVKGRDRKGLVFFQAPTEYAHMQFGFRQSE
jgi:hypothetical protein